MIIDLSSVPGKWNLIVVVCCLQFCFKSTFVNLQSYEGQSDYYQGYDYYSQGGYDQSGYYSGQQYYDQSGYDQNYDYSSYYQQQGTANSNSATSATATSGTTTSSSNQQSM